MKTILLSSRLKSLGFGLTLLIILFGVPLLAVEYYETTSLCRDWHEENTVPIYCSPGQQNCEVRIHEAVIEGESTTYREIASFTYWNHLPGLVLMVKVEDPN